MKKTIRSTLLICLTLLVCMMMFAACDGGAATPANPSSSPTNGSTGGTHTHTFGEWITVNGASCSKDGLEERICSCGTKEEQTIAATGHIPGEWVTESEPTATTTGSKRQYCLVCYALLSEEVIPATGTTGLDYLINEDGITCTVTGIGTCSDSQLVIGATIDGYTVTAISAWAFERCNDLHSVIIPDTVTDIGDGAFSECTGLTSVTLPNGLTAISRNMFQGCTKLKSIVIPDTVTSINYSAFDDCTALTDINIPNGVTRIETIAFSGCTALNNISFPDSVTCVGENVLRDTAYYQNEANWENGVLYAGNHVIAAKTTISGACAIKAGTRTICVFAFRDCTGLTGITVPDGVITIAGDAFYGCTGLTSISFPDSITCMESSVLYNTGYYNNEANWINGVLYAGNHVVAVKEGISGPCVIRPGTRTICDWAFSGRTGVTEISIPDGVTYIGGCAFDNCSSLTSIVIPDSVTHLGKDAFSNCTSLTSATIGKGITSIGYGTFYRCDSMTTLRISGNVTNIGDIAFKGCSFLTDIYFEGTKAQWEAILKGTDWNNFTGNYVIHCTDGDITK